MSPPTSPLRLVLASANPDKAREIAVILDGALDGRVELLARPPEVPDVAETSDSLEGNAALKASALRAATGTGAVADDSGLEVDALGGAPGVRSARYAGPRATYRDNVAKLLSALEQAGARAPEERTARFRTVAVAILEDGRELACSGVVEGRIVDRPRGEGGFGYDPVFAPDDGGGLTFGELDPEAKHAVSARGRAFRSLAAALLAEISSPGTGDASPRSPDHGTLRR
ncbi:MAG: non-canonical purine NTP pyrophosphatase [Actinomycetota bacterium]|nr:non-canonical purine NTP pyrophosphatase [Actinomycetota bacterium]